MQIRSRKSRSRSRSTGGPEFREADLKLVAAAPREEVRGEWSPRNSPRQRCTKESRNRNRSPGRRS
eukprot:1728631-Alexandrium_andersonii.AAC.1